MSKEDLQETRELRVLARALERQGVSLRREKLARGSEFRAKSGECEAFGARLFFVDTALPVPQQLSVVVDYFVEHRLPLLDDELLKLSPARRQLLAVPA